MGHSMGGGAMIWNQLTYKKFGSLIIIDPFMGYFGEGIGN